MQVERGERRKSGGNPQRQRHVGKSEAAASTCAHRQENLRNLCFNRESLFSTDQAPSRGGIRESRGCVTVIQGRSTWALVCANVIVSRGQASLTLLQRQQGEEEPNKEAD